MKLSDKDEKYKILITDMINRYNSIQSSRECYWLKRSDNWQSSDAGFEYQESTETLQNIVNSLQEVLEQLEELFKD
jgi:hypothetical protein